jgi:hypothetical protein
VSKAIQDLLGYQKLCGVIQATTTGIPKVLPPGFSPTPTKTFGDSGRYMQVTGTRTTARLAMYGAPAKMRDLKDIAKRDVKLMHAYEKIQLDPMLYQSLHSYTSYDQARYPVEQEVGRQVREFRRRFENLRTAASLYALSLGHIYFDSGGNLLPSSSGSTYDVDLGVPSANLPAGQSNLATTISGTNASWATAATNIPQYLRLLKKYALKLTGYELTHAFYGTNIPEYFTNNNYLNPFLAREPDRREMYLKEGEIGPEYTLEGIKFYPVYQAFFEDSGGTNRSIFGDNQIVFTPDPSPEWWETMEGTYPVPTSVAIAADATAAMKTFDIVNGMGAWAVPSHDPPTADMFFVDTFLPVIKVPNCIFSIADVTA